MGEVKAADHTPGMPGGRMIPALSIKQPWPLAIIRFGKDVENRMWRSAYRGPLAIHASATWAEEAEFSGVLQAAWKRFAADNDPAAADTRLGKDSPWVVFGAVVAVADLVGICGGEVDEDADECECSSWARPAQYHWRLEGVRPLPDPVPCRGSLKLWGLPRDVREAVQAQL